MSWIERAQVGDKVVCIADDFLEIKGVQYPIIGNVYTLREIELDGRDIFFTLCEIVNVPYLALDNLVHEPTFDATGFRPVKSTDTQVEALKRICLNTPEAVS